MELLSALWALLSVAFCFTQARGSQLQTGDHPTPPRLPPLPNSHVLRRIRGCTPASAAEKITRVLQRTANRGKRGVISSNAHKTIRPLIVAFCRPFERSLLRTLLGCTNSGVSEAESDFEGDDVISEHGNPETGKILAGWQEEEMRNVWSSIGMGLDVLPSGACLFTVESPGCRILRDDEDKEAQKEAKTNENTWGKQRQRDSRNDSSTDGSSASERDGGGAGKASLDMPCATEAAVLASLAAPVVEAADVLLLPLVYQGVAGVAHPSPPDPAKSFGELLYLQEATDTADETTADISNSAGEAEEVERQTGQAPVVCLPEGVQMLLRSMRHLTQQEDAGKEAENAGGLKESVKQKGTLSDSRPTRLPHIVLLFGEPFSPGFEAAVKAQVLRELGNAEARISIINAQVPEGKTQLRRLLNGLSGNRSLRNHTPSDIAKSLAKIFTGPPAFRNPSSLEYPSRAIAAGVCAAAARRALLFARKKFAELQKLHFRASSREPLGLRVQRILCEALSSYDWQTRRFQLALDRRVLRKELQFSLEREARSLYVREALQLEAEAKTRLRAALIKTLQKDAARFNAIAPTILAEAVTSLRKQLESLLPSSATNTPLKYQNEGPQTSGKSSEKEEGALKSLVDSCTDVRDTWLSQLVSNSVIDVHNFLLQRFTRNFSVMALELSRSPLAALLRQQHRRPWLGVSLRPSLALTTLLRMRGEGNLQGYSRYNKGAINFLFGFTNDGEGLKPGQHAALRLQPKLHLDFEVP